jgi:peptide/nickel transport system permease protein
MTETLVPLARAPTAIWPTASSSPVAAIAFIRSPPRSHHGRGAAAVFSVAAPLLAPHNPFDLASLSLMDIQAAAAACGPPTALEPFLLGTDDQGRDVLSAIMYGLRISLIVGVLGVVFAARRHLARPDRRLCRRRRRRLIMRIADVQLTFPAILIALLVDGVVRGVLAIAARRD